VRAPLEASVISALGLRATPRLRWSIHGEQLELGELLAEHLAWYADRPEVVRRGLVEHEDRMRSLGILG
jgi:hypothetical protein